MAYRSPLLAAGLCALALGGCGSEDSALIPRDEADRLSALVDDAGAAAAAGECDTARRSVREAEQQLTGLPRRTDRALKANLRDWLDHLDRTIAEECTTEPEETPTPEVTVEPEETPTPEATPEPTETPVPTATPAPTTTVDPGTGEEGTDGEEEPPATGGVPPEDG
jgi:hypothetical protein